ncbi:MAG: hypothetical protein E2O79_11025 [Caldithrix sp.]|nr:MAG: hypothetical protein E2O79_11025 [Caldithrix sp.]
MNAEPLISFCRNLPKATEDIKWGKDLVFSVGNKMFAVFDQGDNTKVCFKATPAMFSTLTGKSGIISAPYLGRYNWVLVEDLEVLPREMLEDLISESHRLVASKLPAKARQTLGL